MNTILPQIILYCFWKLNRERTTSSVFHILTGKKSAQTIQDVHLFSLTSFFNTVPSLSKDAYEEQMVLLTKQEWLIIGDHVMVTKKGSQQAERLYKQFPYLQLLDGYRYQDSDLVWGRMSLLTQVLSNQVYGNSNYIPVQKNRENQLWVKAFLATYRHLQNEFPRIFMEELEAVLGSQTIINPMVLIHRLTGYQKIGLTATQSARALGMETEIYHFQFLAILHYLMQRAESSLEQFPTLNRLMKTLRHENLTLSTQKTYQLLREGMSLQQICHYRKLKLSTIQDHIVEIALVIKEFDISKYVHISLQKQIITAIEQTSSRQLKVIKQLVEADYFEIRLTMAKYGELT